MSINEYFNALLRKICLFNRMRFGFLMPQLKAEALAQFVNLEVFSYPLEKAEAV